MTGGNAHQKFHLEPFVFLSNRLEIFMIYHDAAFTLYLYCILVYTIKLGIVICWGLLTKRNNLPICYI